MMTGEAAFRGFSPSDILVERTKISALPICPITFVWLLQVFNEFFDLFPPYIPEFLSLK